MIRSNGGRRESCPLRIEPEVGKRSENAVEPPVSESWAVLHEDVARSHLANDAVHLPPEPRPLAIETITATRDRDVLAGEAAGNNIDSPAPGVPVEGVDVVVDLEAVGVEQAGTSGEDVSPVGLGLDGADGAPSEEVAAEQSPTGSGE